MGMKRTKGLCAKFTHAEYAALEALAGGQPMGAWAREQLFAIRARRAIEEMVVGEIAALRTIVLHLQFERFDRDARQVGMQNQTFLGLEDVDRRREQKSLSLGFPVS